MCTQERQLESPLYIQGVSVLDEQNRGLAHSPCQIEQGLIVFFINTNQAHSSPCRFLQCHKLCTYKVLRYYLLSNKLDNTGPVVIKKIMSLCSI
jgi:hypothetical protein